MGSRNREQQQETAPHQPLLSSLVVRLTDNERTADFEPTEVHRDPPSYSHRSARFYQEPQSLPSGYRVNASSVSPVHHRHADHHSSFDHSGGMSHRGPGIENDSGRYRESPTRFNRGRGLDRGFAGHGFRPGPVRGESTGKSNPKIQPREGDWYCSDPACSYLNFARRDHCYSCHQPRHGTEVSPRRAHPSPPPPVRRSSGMDYSPRRVTSGYRSPPRVVRDFGVGHPRNRDRREDRFIDHHLRREQPGYLDNGFDTRSRFDRHEPPVGFTSREHTRDSLFNDRKGYSRGLQSPPPYSFQEQPAGAPSRWARGRSRSPIILREELPLKDYRRGTYMEHGRNERHDMSGNHVVEPAPLSTLQHSSPARWTQKRSRSTLRNELPVSKDYQRDAYISRGRDDRHGMARGGREQY